MYKRSVSFERTIKELVLQVRDELSLIYKVEMNGPYENYTGLCDVATDMFEDLVDRMNTRLGIHMKFKRYHGEQRHSVLSYSSLWPYQHTWASVEIGDRKLYVDITSQQFQKYYKDIPEYYISPKPPKWFYPDIKNLLFNKRIANINKKYKIRKRVNNSDLNSTEKKYIKIGIIEFLQYYVWGNISDFIKTVLDEISCS